MNGTNGREPGPDQPPPARDPGAHTVGWRAGMATVTLAMLGDALSDIPGPALEVGCGDGDLLAALATSQLNQPLIGLDLHLRLQEPPGGGPDHSIYRNLDGHLPEVESSRQLIQADARRVPCADGSIGALLALDVFDQRGIELTDALAESYRVLAPGGMMMLRVSAHTGLYGPHDIAFNTGRRYGRTEMASALITAGFHVQRWTYANSLLAPLLVPQRLLQRWRVAPWRPSVYRAHWSNRLVAAALGAEARWLRRGNLPFGLSLIMIAVKKKTRD